MNALLKNICSILHGVEDYHDPGLKAHELRTGRLMSILGMAFGLKTSLCEILNEIGALHDIGKIAIPEKILAKSGPLSEFEMRVVKLHPLLGYDLIRGIKHKYIKLAGDVILTHHECYDGSGYPNGLKGNDIPLEGSICAIADVYDALREDRSYKNKNSHHAAISKMFDTSPNGLYHKFNPDLMTTFKDITAEVEAIYATV